MRFFDDLVLRERDATGTGSLSERIYPIQDDMANVTALSGLSGVVVERYCYTGYGIPAVMAGDFSQRLASAYRWEVLFGSYRIDAESFLYQARMREYHPGLGTLI